MSPVTMKFLLDCATARKPSGLKFAGSQGGAIAQRNSKQNVNRDIARVSAPERQKRSVKRKAFLFITGLAKQDLRGSGVAAELEARIGFEQSLEVRPVRSVHVVEGV